MKTRTYILLAEMGSRIRGADNDAIRKMYNSKIVGDQIFAQLKLDLISVFGIDLMKMENNELVLEDENMQGASYLQCDVSMQLGNGGELKLNVKLMFFINRVILYFKNTDSKTFNELKYGLAEHIHFIDPLGYYADLGALSL